MSKYLRGAGMPAFPPPASTTGALTKAEDSATFDVEY